MLFRSSKPVRELDDEISSENEREEIAAETLRYGFVLLCIQSINVAVRGGFCIDLCTHGLSDLPKYLESS